MDKQLFIYLLLCISLLLNACTTGEEESNGNVIAVVGDKTLTVNEIMQEYFPQGLSEKDSIALLKSRTREWIEYQLLYQKAELNIADNDGNLQQKVDQYKMDLYIHAYEAEFMNQKLDSMISKKQLEEYYDKHKEELTLNQVAVKPILLVFPKELDLSKAKYWFYSNRPDDIEKLREFAYKFSTKFYFEDTWMEYQTLRQEIPVKNVESSKIFNQNGIILEDSLNYYYLRINEVIQKGEIAPIELVENNIVNIILHKRRIELIHNMRNNIYQDALHKKEFEIYIDNK